MLKIGANAMDNIAPQHIITVDNIVKFYGQRLILDRVSFPVTRGGLLALIGPSGSGKSTLLRLISGLEAPDDGVITFDGQPISDPRVTTDSATKIGLIFQAYNLFPHLDTIGNIALALRKVKKLSRFEARAKAEHCLTQVGLDGYGSHYPEQLSGGQRQRVAIARALALEPSVLLCDEITSALDPELSGEILTVIESLLAAGLTVIMATHEISFVKTLATDVVLLEGGKIVHRAAKDSFFSAESPDRVREFLQAAQRYG